MIALPSPKLRRITNSKAGFYAGFNAPFVDAVLTWLSLPQGSTILDPWLGSGTVAVQALQKNLSFIGMDINPVMVISARARVAAANPHLKLSSLPKLKNKAADNREDPLHAWLDEPSTAHIRALQQYFDRSYSNSDGSPATELQDFNHWALVLALKNIASPRPTTNPTWKLPLSPKNITKAQLKSEFERAQRDLQAEITLLKNPKTSRIEVGDSRQILLQDQSVDAVITSPPYCTRLDYTRATSFELATLGPRIGIPDSASLRSLRLRMMGTSLMRKTILPGDLPDLSASRVRKEDCRSGPLASVSSEERP